MEHFDYAVAVVLKNEGSEYTDNAKDPGGATRYGITLNLYRDYHPSATKSDIQNLSETEAKRIYKLAFWNLAPFEPIRSLRIATSLFDAACNSGIYEAALIVQRACNELESDLNVDGLIGKQTLAAINNSDATLLLNEFRKQREMFYEELVKEKPELREFLNDWLSRARNT